MTDVYFHGVLAKKYGSKCRMAIHEPKDLLRIMEANYDDFLTDLKDLCKKNIHYTFVVNGKWIKKGEPHFGKINRLDFVPIIWGSGPGTVMAIISFAMSVASAIYSYIQAGKVEYPQLPGAEGFSAAFSKSMAFSNRENVIEQGNPVPLVYGRLRIGSFVIQSSVKSFPLFLSLTDEFMMNSSKKGANQIATIDKSISEQFIALI